MAQPQAKPMGTKPSEQKDDSEEKKDEEKVSVQRSVRLVNRTVTVSGGVEVQSSTFSVDVKNQSVKLDGHKDIGAQNKGTKVLFFFIF